MIRWLLAFVCLLCSSLAFSQEHRIPQYTVYIPQVATSPDPYDNGDEPCRLVGEALNAVPYPGYTITHVNPRYGTHPTQGTGCYYDETNRTTGEVTYNMFRQNYVAPFKRCPTGYGTYDDYSQTPAYRYCARVVGTIANKPCKQCDEVGNPIATGNGVKIERTSDSLSSAIHLKRTFRSLDPIANTPLSNLIGKGWHSDLTRKILFTAGDATLPASAMVIRNDGTSMFFAKQTNGTWLPEADLVRYRLEEVQVNSQTNYVITSLDNHQEFYDALGHVYQDVQDGQLMVSYTRDSGGRITGIQDRYGRKASVTYLVTGLIDIISLPDGQTIDFDYDTSNRLISVNKSGDITTYSYVDIVGGAATYLSGVTHNGVAYANFGYNAQAKAIFTEHAGGVDRFDVVYSNNDDTATVTTPTGSTKVFQFTKALGSRIPTSHQITGLGVLNATRAYTYDGFSNVASDKSDTLLSCHYYDASGRYKTATYEYPLTVTACPTTQTAAASTTTFLRANTSVWDAVVNVVTERSVINPNASVASRTKYTYNPRGQATAMCQIDPSNTTAMSYVCGSATNAPTGVRQSTMTYCEQAGVTAGTCPIVGLMLSSDGARTDVSDITSYSYYQSDASTCATAPTTCAYRKGDLWKVTNALSHVMETTAYDGAGRALQMKDANNVITDMLYHPRGWLTHRKVRGTDNASEADDAITKMDYDATGQVIKVTQPDGDFINFTYDAAHRLTAISDALGNSMSYTLDNAGNRTAETTKDPSNVIKRSLSRVYDTLGRLQASKNAAGTVLATLTYDANDNLNTSTDGLSRVTDQDVDPLNRLIKTIQDQGTGKINATTQFEYDARDNLTKVIDPKALNTVYTYNGLNDLTALASPDTGSTSYTYDSAGNRKTQTDAKLVVSNYAYDVLNRLTQLSYPSATGLSSNFIYDTVNTICGTTETFAKGRLTKFTDPSGDTQYCYDRLGNLTRKQVTNNAIINTLLFGYTKSGRLSSITYPSGMVVNYTRNTIGQITQVNATQGATTTTIVNNVQYLPMGPIKQLSFPVPAGGTATSALTQTRNYDNDYAIQSIGGLSYSVDVLGNITNISDATGSNGFLYDNMDRLKQVTNTTGANVSLFTYDATGNRLSKKVGTAAVVNNTYPTTSHRLTNVGTVARTLDANGNTTKSDTTKLFTYDARNRLVDFRTGTLASTIVSQYQFNAKGERVRKYKGTVDQSRYVYNEGGQLLIQNRIVSGVTTTQEIIWLDDMPIGVSQGGTLHGILTDHLNAPRQVFQLNNQTKVWAWSSLNDAFGENAALEDPDANGIAFKFDPRFPGQLADSESGMVYNYLRDCYEASTGRYCQSDPIGLGGGSSTYSYVGGNPLGFSDPFGLQAQPSLFPSGPGPSPSTPLIMPPGPGFGPAANETIFAVPASSFGALCTSIAAAVVGGLMPGNVFDGVGPSCNDDPNHERQECRNDDNECSALSAKINIAINGIARRLRQLRENKGGIDQDTHWAQLRGRQVNLRKLLVEATIKRCKIRPDAWTWATRSR
jgi:RHS repeat-associated protein